MSEWQKEFKRKIINVIVNNGSPVDTTKTDAWGWINSDWEAISREVTNSGIDYDKTTFEESEWFEFMGTFDGDSRKYGVDAIIVLNNGNTYTYRYSGTVSDLVTALVRDL